MPTDLLLLPAPAALIAAALFAATRPGPRPRLVPDAAELAGLVAVLASAAAAVGLALGGPATGETLGAEGFGFSLRLDAVSVTLALTVSLVGWAVLRYTRRYLDGEAQQGAFTGWICATVAAALVLVQSGNLVQLAAAWVATSLCLHRLLLFYPARPAARRAARKKFVMARAGDAALIAGCAILAAGYGTGDIAAILDAARAGGPAPHAVAAAGLLGLAALVKSAQFPTHGWLTEMMESPTPASALLHAGVVNAGGFLLIRFAEVMLLAPGVLAGLALIGGFTALLGGLVMLTQPAVKTSLAWSTVAQMGFMILQCGLGLFGLALLHIVAHSLYKAHAFLASGHAVEAVAALRRPGPVAVPGRAAVGRAFLAALGLYAVAGAAFGLLGKPPQAIALGAILILGVAYLFAQGLADAAPRALTQRVTMRALAATLGYFALHELAGLVAGGTLPPVPAPGPLEWLVMALTVLGFGAVALAQATLPLWAGHPAVAPLRVHLANGLYANAVFDRLTGGWSARKPV